jgi:hypothetical protein
MFVWEAIKDSWPSLEHLAGGCFVHIVIEDEISRLFFAAVLPNDGQWCLSLLLDGVFSESEISFSTSEEGQQTAEHVLAQHLDGCVWLCPQTFAEPFHEVAALLCLTILEGQARISHISEYLREWVVVCIEEGRLEDYAFQRDSDGIMGMRLKRDRLEVCSPSGGDA